MENEPAWVTELIHDVAASVNGDAIAGACLMLQLARTNPRLRAYFETMAATLSPPPLPEGGNVVPIEAGKKK